MPVPQNISEAQSLPEQLTQDGSHLAFVGTRQGIKQSRTTESGFMRYVIPNRISFKQLKSDADGSSVEMLVPQEPCHLESAPACRPRGLQLGVSAGDAVSLSQTFQCELRPLFIRALLVLYYVLAVTTVVVACLCI